MKLCTRHQGNLIEQVKRKGMWRLVPHDPETARQLAQKWLQGTARPDELDPLGVSLLEIYHKAYNMIGVYVNHPHFCALCEVERTYGGEEAADIWVDNCTDAVLAVCTANGLMTSH